MSRSATRVTALSTRAERVERGRDLRAAVPRTSHADFQAGYRRSDPLALLESADGARAPELVPVRYGRMAASPFAYFRGAALPMASDLARTVDCGLTVQSCGDAHVANFGAFGSSPRDLYFDIDGFDETLPGPWEWDLKRLATSMEIVGRDNDYPSRVRRRIVIATVAEYRRAMREFAGRTVLDVWHARANLASMRFAPARARPGLGDLGLTTGPPGLLRAYRRNLEPERRVLYDQYRFVGFTRPPAGAGTRSWLVHLLGDDEQDPLVLQAREAGPSVLEAFTKPSEFDNAGRRVVVGQRLMQAVADLFLGWVRIPGEAGGQDFYVRRLRDRQGQGPLETMPPTAMQTYGELCAWTLARAHARTGDRIAIAAYLGSGDVFDHAIREFTVAYADQNERDHTTLVEAIKRGRIQAEYAA